MAQHHSELGAPGEMVPPPIAHLIGIVRKSIERGHAVFEMQADERHHNPLGTMHGGVYCDLGDLAMGNAYASTLGEGESFTTLELKINFLRRGPQSHVDRRRKGGEGRHDRRLRRM